MVQSILEMSGEIRSDEVARSLDADGESVGVVQAINNLSIETAGTEDEAVERLEVVLGMEINGECEVEVKSEEGGVGTQGELRSLDSLTQDADTS